MIKKKLNIKKYRFKKKLNIKKSKFKKKFIRQYFLYKKQLRKALIKRKLFFNYGTFRIKRMRKKFFS